jgi:hypothetical protein
MTFIQHYGEENKLREEMERIINEHGLDHLMDILALEKR